MIRIAVEGEEGSRLILWHALSLVLVVLGPTMVRLGIPFWELSERAIPQVPVLTVGYLLTALLLTLAARTSRDFRLPGAALLGVVAFAVPLLLFLELVDLGYSRIVVAISGSLGFVLAVIPHVLSLRVFRVSLRILAVTCAATVSWASYATIGRPQVETEPTRRRSSFVTGTTLHNIRITFHRALVPRAPSNGGGLDVYGDGFIVGSAVGEFRQLRWDGSSLVSADLALPPLLNRDRFIADNSPQVEGRHFRIMDLIVDTIPTTHRILVSHYLWDPEERCVTMRVSGTEIPGPGGLAHSGTWETLFTAQPCVPFDGTSVLTNHSGGRMAWSPEGTLMLALGDMGQAGADGRNLYSQDLGVDWGKILVIDSGGEAELLSLGHRNPEGLLVTSAGMIWSTEHGPRGGDELNIIERDGNYGWPLATYGSEAESTTWRLADGRQDHEGFIEPVYTWLPSVGVSNLLELGPDQFPAWQGDLLIASLNGQSLFRVRVRSGRVIYAEPIWVGRRVRDLVEDQQGRVLLWTDQSDLVSVVDSGLERTGEIVYSECATCHERREEPSLGRTGPDLRDLIGREAGSLPDYPFSEALRELDLVWTEEELDEFLSDPRAFVPGTTMNTEGISAADRRVVIDFLRRYDRPLRSR